MAKKFWGRGNCPPLTMMLLTLVQYLHTGLSFEMLVKKYALQDCPLFHLMFQHHCCCPSNRNCTDGENWAKAKKKQFLHFNLSMHSQSQ